LVKSRAIIVHENQTNAFAIVDLKSGEVVAGESVARPRLSLTMTPAHRDIVARVAMLPEEERLELLRYLSAQLGVHDYAVERLKRLRRNL
jgi:hypothetical protein